jgi:hypothetical protein
MMRLDGVRLSEVPLRFSGSSFSFLLLICMFHPIVKFGIQTRFTRLKSGKGWTAEVFILFVQFFYSTPRGSVVFFRYFLFSSLRRQNFTSYLGATSKRGKGPGVRCTAALDKSFFQQLSGKTGFDSPRSHLLGFAIFSSSLSRILVPSCAVVKFGTRN